MTRYAKKVDANHGDVKDALVSVGAVVIDLSPVGNGVPDMAVLFRGRTVWMEIKSDKQCASKREPNPVQKRWHALARTAGVSVHVVTTPHEAIQILQAIPRHAWKGKP